MATGQLGPRTPPTRSRWVSDFPEIPAPEPEKPLPEPLKRTGGRNNKGHITSRYMSGGHKRQYRRNHLPRDKFADPARRAAGGEDPKPPARHPPLHPARRGKRLLPAPEGPERCGHGRVR